MTTPIVYFHAGLGKVASTYLQKSVFPALEGIYYLPRDRFRRHHKLIQAAEYPAYFLSREAGKHLIERLEAFARIYPEARLLLFFRRQDEWIASHYRRYVKNGGTEPFDRYLDLDHDNGIWKQEQLRYVELIEQARRIFGRDPFILTYDRLREDPDEFAQRIATYLDARINPEKMCTRQVHGSHSPRKLRAVRKLSRILRLPDPERQNVKRRFHRLRRRLELIRSHLLLLLAGVLPASWAADEDLTPGSHMQRIREHYHSDWDSIVAMEAAQFNSQVANSRGDAQ